MIINTAWRRYLFSFAHAVDSDVDIQIAPHGKQDLQAPDIADDITDLENYDLVFIANCRSLTSSFSSFSPEDVRVISDHLSNHDFSIAAPAVAYEGDESSLTVFRKESGSL
ncbi:MAG: hypothetical protein KAT00_06515 [Planctomycetes bacterium]|nr:hypothetical protein [Planctomycetota bacterium]